MSLMRRMVEKFFRGKVFLRKMPAKYGGARLYVSPDCGLRYLNRDVATADPALLEQVRRLVTPGAVVWDVGANLGLFSFAAAGLAGPTGDVFSFEPDAFLITLLRRSAKLRGPAEAEVNVVPTAVDEGAAIATFHVSERSRAMNSLAGLGAPQGNDVREKQHVMTVSLDWLLTQLPPPNVLKIDAEGAELRILRGATGLLTTHKPRLALEVYDESADEVTALLHSYGYTLYDGEATDEVLQPIARATYSTMAIAG